MRFNDKHTCIEFITNGIPEDFVLLRRAWPEAKRIQYKTELRETFPGVVFGDRIQYITQPFYEAYSKHKNKMIDVLKTESIGDATGTFIIRASDGVTKTMFYAIQHQISPMKLNFLYYEFSRSSKNNYTALGAAMQYISGREEMNYHIADEYVDKLGEDCKELMIAELLMMACFLKFCPVETKILKPKEKLREFNVKYFNETKFNIEILDSTWFTTLVKSEGFGVRGHLRLQPYGPGMMQKKFIWIDSFEKTGYERKAKVILQDGTNEAH
jgi:hypothetical protein